MKKSAPAAVAVPAMLACLLAACGPSESRPPAGPEKAPALSLPSLSGKTISLTDFAGKVVLVDFWASWCEPCRDEVPDLVKLRGNRKEKGFEILGVSMDEEGAKAVEAFVSERRIPYPIALNGGERAPAGWTVPGLPTAYLIGRDGTVRRRWFGAKDAAELALAVDDALGK